MRALLDWKAVRDAFAARFGGGDPRVFFAPGRVNLIGEHVDYSGGRVLPVAIDLGIYAAIRPRADDVWRVASTAEPGERAVSSSAIPQLRAERAWNDYPVGALQVLSQQGGL